MFTASQWIAILAIFSPLFLATVLGLMRQARSDEKKDVMINNMNGRLVKVEGQVEILSADLLDLLHSCDKRLALIEAVLQKQDKYDDRR